MRISDEWVAANEWKKKPHQRSHCFMFKKLEQQRFLRDRESSSWTLKAKTKTWSSQNKCLLPQPTWTVSSSEVTRRALRLRLRAVPVFVERAAGLRRIGRSLKWQMRWNNEIFVSWSESSDLWVFGDDSKSATNRWKRIWQLGETSFQMTFEKSPTVVKF